MTYRKELNHPKWQKKRLHIFERDGWKCVACGADDIQLHAHHTVYTNGAKPWEYDDDLIVTLCMHCHHAAHWIDRIEGEVMGVVIPWSPIIPEQECKPYRWTGVIERENHPTKDEIYHAVDFLTGYETTFQADSAMLYRKPPEITKAKLYQWINRCQTDFDNMLNEWDRLNEGQPQLEEAQEEQPKNFDHLF